MLRFRDLGVFVFEFWMLRFRDLGVFVFEIWVLRASVFVFDCFVFETTGFLPLILSLKLIMLQSRFGFDFGIKEK